MATASTDNADIFVYMGGGLIVPRDVVRCRVHPSVTRIPNRAFDYNYKLEEVELCEGLLEIGARAFGGCALKRIKFPSTVTVIREKAFEICQQLEKIKLPEGMEYIGEGTFSGCVCMFSVELSENMKIAVHTFNQCNSLRNIALKPRRRYSDLGHIFGSCTDLQQVLGSETQIIDALRRRFNNLPIHKMVYYQNNVTSDQLTNAANMRSGRAELDPAGKQQDCLGMTPLHILACSTVQNLELYRVLVKLYPENLITEDEWGALPLLYALWGNAPTEIVQFLVESYQTLYPGQEFDWTMMVEILGNAASLNVVQNLLGVQREFFPEQRIDWDQVLANLVRGKKGHEPNATDDVFRLLIKSGLSKRVDAIGLKIWREDITHTIENIKLTRSYPWTPDGRLAAIEEIRKKLARYEVEYLKLKEATSMLELALWKNKIESGSRERGWKCKKVKVDDKAVRNQCRINCGAEMIIENVLPYLVPKCIQHI